jgi:4a-hydroxytetrahydrobiopterin dehydratase
MSEAYQLEGKSCVPCREGSPSLGEAAIAGYRPRVPLWEVKVVDGMKRLERQFQFVDFVQAMRFVNDIATVAEDQGHHPDVHIHWNQVRLELWTHTIGGLHENDFIMASKIDQVGSQHGRPAR